MEKPIILLLICAFFFIGCDTDSIPLLSSGGPEHTAEEHDLELRDGLESKVPMPERVGMLMDHLSDDIHNIQFTYPGMTYDDAVEFYSENLRRGGWTIVEEETKTFAEVESGEDGSQWVVEGHGVEMSVAVIPLGGGWVHMWVNYDP